MKIIRLLAISAIFLFVTETVMAANYYVRAGASGAQNGSDWNNAYTSLPATLGRGDTYYMADGSYGSYTFDDADSGTNFIYIKKATTTDHGTDTGWSSTYGDGTSVFTNWYFDGNYYDIDGQVGLWADFLPGYVAYGIKVSRTTTADNQNVVHIGGSGNPRRNLVFKHIEITQGNTPRTGTWHRAGNGVYGYGGNWTFQYCWIHDVGAVGILGVGADDVVVDKSALGRNGQAQVAMNFNPSEHAEVIMLHPDADRWTFQYSYFYDWRSTGLWVLYDLNDDIIFHGNVVFQTGYYAVPSEANDSDGILSGLSGTNTGTKLINNTFANITYGASIAQFGTFKDFKMENNLFYKVKRYGAPTSIQLPGISVRQYNWYYGVGTITTETGEQNGNGDPFVDSMNYDFRLSAPTNAGLIWSSPYNVTGDDKIRGEDAVWDRGAYEYVLDIIRPNPPGNLR